VKKNEGRSLDSIHIAPHVCRGHKLHSGPGNTYAHDLLLLTARFFAGTEMLGLNIFHRGVHARRLRIPLIHLPTLKPFREIFMLTFQATFSQTQPDISVS